MLTTALCFAQSAKPQKTATPVSDYNGTYSFLRAGEFVQINIEDGNRLTGFISHHGNDGKAIFVDHFFENAELHDRHIRFSTRKVNGVWFDFDGSVARGAGTTRSAEDYYEITGTLTEHASDASQKGTARESKVTFHSLRQEICD